MKYRKFGKLDFEVSALGFGTMRLPTEGSASSGNRLSADIVEAEAIKMIRYAIDQGVNYIDTAYPYHKGCSEVVTGKALQDGYRDKIKLATKSPVWLIKEPADFDRLLDEQLKRLQTDHIDFYMLHALDSDRWNNIILKLHLLEKAEAALAAGKIKHFGFSFHGGVNEFIEIVDGYDKWEFCQIQYNYMDIEYQAGMRGLQYAASKGLAVIIMEPLLGGRLSNPPKSVKALFEQYHTNRSPADWALQWLWNQPEVSVVLSGMSNSLQVEENIKSADQSGVGIFGPEDSSLIDLVRKKYKEKAAIPCTGCSYCIPCPKFVNIPRCFELYNGSIVHDDLAGSRLVYNNFVAPANRASACINCKECEKKCPQGIKITQWLPKVHELLSNK